MWNCRYGSVVRHVISRSNPKIGVYFWMSYKHDFTYVKTREGKPMSKSWQIEFLIDKEIDIKCHLFPYKIQHDKAPPAGVWLSKWMGNCSCPASWLPLDIFMYHTCIKGKVKSNLVFQILFQYEIYIFQDKKTNQVSLCHAWCPTVILLLQHPQAGAAAPPLDPHVTGAVFLLCTTSSSPVAHRTLIEQGIKR